MLRRASLIALLIFQAVWLNVIVPGHTRGVVALPGTECEACCQSPSACHLASHSQPSHPAPVRDPASGCAICQFAAHLTLPPVIDLSPPKLGLAEIFSPPAPRSAISVRIPRVLHDRAPPAVA